MASPIFRSLTSLKILKTESQLDTIGTFLIMCGGTKYSTMNGTDDIASNMNVDFMYSFAIFFGFLI